MKLSTSSIQWKLNLGLLLIVAALLGVLSWVLRGDFQARFQDQQRAQVAASGNLLVSQFEQQLVHVQAIAESLARFAEVSAYERQRFHDGLKQLLDVPGTEAMIAGGGFWPEPFMLDPDRERRSFFWGRDGVGALRYYDDYNHADGSGYHRQPWYVPGRYMKGGRCYWSPSYVDPYSLEPMVTCTVPAHRDGRLLGVATVDMRLSGIRAYVARNADSRLGYAFLIDQNGHFIAHPRLRELLAGTRADTKRMPGLRDLGDEEVMRPL